MRRRMIITFSWWCSRRTWVPPTRRGWWGSRPAAGRRRYRSARARAPGPGPRRTAPIRAQYWDSRPIRDQYWVYCVPGPSLGRRGAGRRPRWSRGRWWWRAAPAAAPPHSACTSPATQHLKWYLNSINIIMECHFFLNSPIWHDNTF